MSSVHLTSLYIIMLCLHPNVQYLQNSDYIIMYKVNIIMYFLNKKWSAYIIMYFSYIITLFNTITKSLLRKSMYIYNTPQPCAMLTVADEVLGVLNTFQTVCQQTDMPAHFTKS